MLQKQGTEANKLHGGQEEAREEKGGKFTKLNYLGQSNRRKKIVVVLCKCEVTAKNLNLPPFQNSAPETRSMLF